MSHLLKTTDTLVARSEHGLLYRSYNGQYFVVCECGKMLGLKVTRSDAQKSWAIHWTSRPFCNRKVD